MAEEQDKTHRLLLQFPRMVKDLILLCLGGEWVERLDFETLERVPERLLSKELVRREQDVLWRVKYFPEGKSAAKASLDPASRARTYLDDEEIEYLEEEDEYFYIYLHIEHQLRPRQLMALDMVTYKLIALQDLTRKGYKAGDKLPTIFSLVFYNGEGPWNVATSLEEILPEDLEGAPEGLGFLSYLLIDAQRVNLEELLGADSPLLGLFRLEQLGAVGELGQVAAELKATLGPEDEKLEETFVSFINDAILPKLTPKGVRQLRIEDLQEMPTMVTQRIERITQGWLLEGKKEGEEIGIRKGKKEGEELGIRKGHLAMLRRLLEHKFGELSPDVVERLERADVDLLLLWSDRVLAAAALGGVFEE
jgi:hypothetical protein